MLAKSSKEPTSLNEISPFYRVASDGGIDLTLLKDSLSKTPWERMRANDDALNYAESLREAMLKRAIESP